MALCRGCSKPIPCHCHIAPAVEIRPGVYQAALPHHREARTTSMSDLDVYEHETEAFTPNETRAIFDYEAAIHGSGLYDCFDSLGVEQIRSHETEFGQDATRDMLREHAGMLNTWYLALDALLGDILTCTSEVTRYSTAASRYVKAMAEDYHRTRQNFEHVTTIWSLALLTGGADADYPPPTRAVSYPMQFLTEE